MPSDTNAAASRRRRKRVLKAAKGFRGFRSTHFSYAKDAVRKSMQYHYRDRKVRKRSFRKLWILRINIATRAEGLTYSRFIEGLNAAGIEMDRKVLADMAVKDEAGFKALVQLAKAAFEKKTKEAGNKKAAA